MLLLTLSAINATKKINGVPKDLCKKENKQPYFCKKENKQLYLTWLEWLRKQAILFNITWIAVGGIFSEIPYDFTIFIENAQFLIWLFVCTMTVGDKKESFLKLQNPIDGTAWRKNAGIRAGYM